MSLTTTEVFGFADKVSAAMDSNSVQLAANGLTVGPLKTSGDTLKTNAVQQVDLEAKAKTALSIQTKAAQAALQAVYDHYSSKLDAMVGVIGKTTPKGKELLRLRSDIRRGPNDAGSAPAPGKT